MSIESEIKSGINSGVKGAQASWQAQQATEDDVQSNWQANRNFLKKLVVGRHIGTDKEAQYIKIYKILNILFTPGFFFVSYFLVTTLETLWVLIFKKQSPINWSHNLIKILTFIGGATLSVLIIVMSGYAFIMGMIQDPVEMIGFVFTKVLPLILTIIGIGIAINLLKKMVTKVSDYSTDTSDIDDAINAHNERKSN